MIEERYELAVGRIREIRTEQTVDGMFQDYFQKLADFVIMIDELRNVLSDGSYNDLSMEELMRWNQRLYFDILPEQYEKSYANPAYAVRALGKEYGGLLSFLYAEIRGMIVYAFEGRTEYLDILMELFIEIYNQFEEELPEEKSVKDILYWYASDYCDVFVADRIREQILPEESFAADIIRDNDLSDLRYLYRFGEYVGENELKSAQYMNSLPEETIRRMADVYTEGYRTGFVNTGKDLSKKSVVNIRYVLGFERVVRKLGIPVITGWNSQDLMPDDHPLYVGRAGGMGDRPGNFAIQNSDLVFSVGSRLSIRQVGYNYSTWAREAYTIINDIDQEELKKPSLHVDMPVHADAKDLLEALERVLDQQEEKPLFGGGTGLRGMTWVETCQMWKEKYPVVRPKHLVKDDTKAANVYALVKELSQRLSEGQITVVGNGSACVVGGHAFIIKKGQRFITNSAVASMGYDLPAAIGACMADSGQDIILLTGDGSIQMNIQELQTIIHHHMPIKIFLINNDGYHSIRQTQKNFFREPLVGIGGDSRDLSFPNMEKLAWAYGYPYVSARRNGELGEAIERTLAMEGPVICEIFVTTDQNFEPKSAAKRLPDGTMVSPPLEDLFPFLSEEEMDENMLIPRVGKQEKA